MSIDMGELHQQLVRWAEYHYQSGAEIGHLEAMPGNAGLSFGFTVEVEGEVVDRLVTRMPPKGVRRRGNTDVLRQVPLLQALRAQHIPVAPVRWWSADEQWFDVPYFMVEYLNGASYRPRDPDPMFDGVTYSALLRSAVETLATVHLVSHADALPDWEEPKDLTDEIHFWSPILQKAAEPEWITAGERARDALLASVPDAPSVGIFHGDFQTNNVLFDGTRVVAIVDWEISGIGAQLLDLGWLLFMNDAESRIDNAGLSGVPPFADIVGWYSDAIGRPVSLDDVAFYRALAGYRFGVISGLNVMLHRTGKRHDPAWDDIALSVPAMFATASRLLD